MDKCDLSVHEATNQHILGIGDRSEHSENLAALRMRPPAAFDGLVDDGLRQPRHRTLGRGQYDAVLFDESERFSCRHAGPRYSYRQMLDQTTPITGDHRCWRRAILCSLVSES